MCSIGLVFSTNVCIRKGSIVVPRFSARFLAAFLAGQPKWPQQYGGGVIIFSPPALF